MARSYQDHIDATLRAQQERTAGAQDIGDIPPCGNPERREKCSQSFPDFCQTYGERTFYLPWAPFHYSAAVKIERAVMDGGRFAFAMPRSSGKTSLCEWAALWAILYGFRQYVMMIGATESSAEQRLANLKVLLETNDQLLDDFPEAVYPIRRLEGSVRRCEGQKFRGHRTAIAWGQKFLRLPTIPGSPSSGAIIEVASITGEIRGKVRKSRDGASLRPSLAIVDDPQTRESAKSETQSRDREAVIAGDVAYMAGPDSPIAVIVPCTVIYRDDLADRLLNRAMHPSWQGDRTKMVLAWPDNERLWAEYADIWANDLRLGGDGTAATEFYRAKQPEMDHGAVVSWPERFIRGVELSAVEHVMRLRLHDEAAFMAEYQNDPVAQQTSSLPELAPDMVARKVNGMRRGQVPLQANILTAFVDVQQSLLYWVIVAWEDDFTGYVIDYGTTPDQGRRQFTLGTARNTLQSANPNAGLEGQLYSGLVATFSPTCLGRTWRRDADGAELRIERAMIDANWAQTTELVYQFCRESDMRERLIPSHGKGIGVSGKPWEHYQPRRGQRMGHHWLMPARNRDRPVRHLIFDTNYWKSFIHARWLVARGDPGSLTLYGCHLNGHEVQVSEHLNFAAHQCAEYCVRTEANGRTVDEWKQKPHNPDNHWWDCLVGAAVAASVSGIQMVGAIAPRRQVATLPRITKDYLRAIGR